MSKEASASLSGCVGRDFSNTSRAESNENEFEASPSAFHFPPPRTPFNIIADPAQHQNDFRDFGFDSNHKFLLIKPDWSSDRKLEISYKNGNACTNHGTPKFSGNGRKVLSEPSSTQSTPAKSSSRFSLGGAIVAAGSKAPQHVGVRGGSSFRVSRRISIPNTEVPADAEVPHFELVEDPSFWKDHNVQVLIRLRPLSTTERISQGYGRCLRQETAKTLVWLGHPETRFTFDHIACETISQEKLFEVAGQPMVENCMSGYNSCMFAYGQTGSGKTYTMMGGISEVEGKLSEDCGLTLRIFEHLFTRIRLEEESKRDAKLKYSCKCSFLEIYNEQITDLLEPSSTNLQLREDLKKGVYAENLTEHHVMTINDVVKLLLQGAANRKMAATNMNSESSRSHSVFTCIIESHWEKDSMTHFRFARLNLVDLAGSERQKSSGAEGDRLKEAANINKSLSTLGLVIMSLVDLAHGKHRHVPYRDSRLTFLLQDSLGGNSKTTIIANVSPSLCSANETLSTLKFAQRAKQIQNNAKVNEDASGDETALQRQILQLKGQLSFLLKHSDLSKSLLSCIPTSEESRMSDFFEAYDASLGRMQNKNHKMKPMEATLVSALKREKVAEAEIQKLEFEIEHMKLLAFQQEEDAQRAKMLLKFREEKIRQLELLLGGMLSADEYLLEENKALVVEIKMLQAKLNRNPELTRVSLENSKLIEQLQVFQNFYEQGEREALLTEVAELRNELLVALGNNSMISERDEYQDFHTMEGLVNHEDPPTRPTRKNELQTVTGNHLRCSRDYASNSFSKHPKQVGQTDSISLDETMSIKSYYRDDLLSYITGDDENSEYEIGRGFDHSFNIKPINYQKDPTDARLSIETIDSDHNMQDEEHKCKLVKDQNEGVDMKALQAKLEKLTRELEEVRLSNIQFQENQIFQQSQQNKIEHVRQQAEMETASTILQLQEEVEALQLELNNRLYDLAQENTQLKNALSAKDEEMRMLCIDWETAMVELTSFLLDSSRSIRDAHWQIEGIANLFPKVNIGISEQLQRAIEVCIEKEERILLLHQSLEDAQRMVQEMEQKLDSLKGATLALNELQQMHDNESPADAKQLSILTADKTIMAGFLEKRLEVNEDQLVEAGKHAWLSPSQELACCNNIGSKIPIIADGMASWNAPLLKELDSEVDLQLGLVELKNITSAHYADMERHVSALYTYIHDLYSDYRELVQDLVGEIHELKLKSKAINKNCKSPLDELTSTHKYWNIQNQNNVLDQIKDRLFEAKNRLNILEDSIDRNISACGCQFTDQYSVKEDGWSSDCSTSSSEISTGSVTSRGEHNGSLHSHFNSLEGDLVFCEVGKKRGTTCLRKELCMTRDAFQKLCLQIDAFLRHDIGGCSLSEETDQAKTPPKLMMEKVEASCITSKAVSVEELKLDVGFFTKFEEAQATIKEADIMLNELLRANEDAKHITSIFKLAGEQLQLERANLIEEIGQLKCSMHLKETENQLLQEQFWFNMEEVTKSVSSLERCISQMQREVDEKFGMLSCDVISMSYEVLKIITNWKSLTEDISSELMGRDLASFILSQCYVEELCRQFALFRAEHGFQILKQQWCMVSNNNLGPTCLIDKDDVMLSYKINRSGRSELVSSEEANGGFSDDDIVCENIALKKELKRKEVLLDGLLFDFRLLQESTSKKKDVKDEAEKLDFSLSQLQHELEIKASQLNNVLVQQRKLEGHLTNTEKALFLSNSKLDKAKKTIITISEHNAELEMHLEDIYLKKSEAEKQMAEQQDVVNKLETEILHLNSSVDEKLLATVQGIENELRRVTSERDQLHEQVCFLTDKLVIAYALADEKEAVAVEARQESEASKLYAEQKEEEVKILERSVEELESTVNMLEKKVHEMDEEVERNSTLRESLEMETQIFRRRLLAVENLTEVMDSKDEVIAREGLRQEDSIKLELLEARSRIKLLEEERAEQDKEIKRHKEYISELVLHADAQATKYQQKYTNLEAMVHDASKSLSNPKTAPTIDKYEKSSVRPRGSSSPFRCISNLVHQMNLEKEHELSAARFRIEELEGLATSRQKEICILNARLAAAESMTHDVIRDLLGVKLDLTKYANMIDQYQVQKIVVEAHRQTQQIREKEQEVHDLRAQIKDLNDERESYKSVLREREAEALAAQIAYGKLRDRDHLLSAQNEMLKMDNKNLKRRIVELDDKVSTLHQTQSGPREIHRAMRTMDDEITKRLCHSKMLLSRVNDEIARHRMPGSSSSHR